MSLLTQIIWGAKEIHWRISHSSLAGQVGQPHLPHHLTNLPTVFKPNVKGHTHLETKEQNTPQKVPF